MQVSLFPEITFPKIKIIANNGEQPVDKMMIAVTKPLENVVKQIPDLEMLRSTTSRGSCEIAAFLKWGSDIDKNLQMLQLRIDQAKINLPAEVKIEVEKMNPSILPVIGFTLESKTKTPIELNLIANYTVKPYLSQVKGVSEVRIIGGKVKEYWLVLNPQKMSSFAITPDILTNIIGQTNFITSNGYLSDYRRMYLTLTDAGIYRKTELENLVIRNDGKRVILLKDIASIQVRERTEYTKINANGKQALLIAVLKQPNTNLVELAEKVNEKKLLLDKLLPKDVKLKFYYNQATFVNDAIKSVSDSLWLGLFLAIFIAVLFLRSLKAGTTIFITIPVTLFLTITALTLFGYDLNIMTLGAIAASIGLIIDDAVVVVEQIHRTHEENPDLATHILVYKAVKYLFPSMVGSSISTIVIFVPFMLMGGVAGAYFNVLTNTMIITLVCSFFVTWIALPVIYILLSEIRVKSRKPSIHSSKVVQQRKWVAYFIRKPVISIVFVVVLIIFAIVSLLKTETGFLPEMDEGSIVLDYNSPPGTSLEETDRMLREVEKIIVRIPEYESYSRRTGTEMGFFITEPNRGDYLIQLKKNRKRSTEEVIADIRKKVEASQPALRIDFGQVIGDMLGDLMESVQPIEIKIFGDNQEKLNLIADQVSSIIENVKGTADVFNGIVIAGPSIDIIPNSRKLAQFNLTPVSFQFQLQAQLEGNIIGSIPEREQRTDIRMVFPGNTNSSLEKIKQQFIFLPNGKLKPIDELAEIKIGNGVAEINRENIQSVAIVTARLDNRGLGNVMNDIQKQIKKNILLPQGYHISYGGAYADQQKSFSELMLILITSAILVFALILFLYKDFKAAVIILFIAIIGTCGSIIALYITGTPLNVGSYTGLIMIVGIIGENAIFTYQQFATRRETEDVDNALIFAISTRLRPKLMTALGAIIALLPLSIGIGAGAQMHRPLAIAVIGGFIVALPLLLIVYPALLRIAYHQTIQDNIEK
jgi:CzcA family heavy metal efflux pump